MKKIIAFLLIIFMLIPNAVLAEETNGTTVYIFGDDWARDWGEELSGFFFDSANLVNCATIGDTLTKIEKHSQYALIDKNDVVVISYGILEKDRPGDNNAEYKKALETVTDYIQKKGAQVIFASVCSTMRFNTVTGQMAETKNYYTETTRSFAKGKNITYIDLAALTASWASSLGQSGATRLYKTSLSLTDAANRMCAFEIYKELLNEESLKGKIKLNLSQVNNVQPGETGKAFDVFFQENLTKNFTVYIKGGNNVYINNTFAGNGDGAYKAQSIDGKINITFAACEKIQVTPSFRFDAAGFSTTEVPFEGSIYQGVYDVTVRKTEPLRASVYLNSYLIASNLDMPGTQAVDVPNELTFEKYCLSDNKFSVTVTGKTDKLDYISFSEAAVIYDDKPRIFIGGDSTVCNYYPLVRTGLEEDGTVMTGWGMLLDRYIDATVTNLAASGDWAANWIKTTFPIVEKEGEKGDLFIVQFGINDHDKSTIEEMKAALGEMIDRTAAKGMIPVLVSPQISAGYGWGDESNVGKSDGGAYEEFFSAVRALAAEKGCFYVDLTDLSSGWFSEIGRDNVYKKYHIWDYENNKPGDMMHLSYKGADAMCRFFVTGLEKLAQSNQTDKWGNSLSSLKFW